MNTTASRLNVSRACSAQARCPIWMGSNVPPMMPRRTATAVGPKIVEALADHGGSRRLLAPGADAGLREDHRYGTHLPLSPRSYVLVRGQALEREGAAHVQLLRGDADLGAQAEACRRR